MDSLEFELNKVKKEILRHGEEYKFYRAEKNEFGEPVGEEKEVCVIKGIYHEERGYVSLKTQEGATIKSKSEGQILCIINEELESDTEIEEDFEDTEEFRNEIQQGDYVHIGLNKYYVINVTDIQNYGIIANISLDLVV